MFNISELVSSSVEQNVPHVTILTFYHNNFKCLVQSFEICLLYI